MKIFIMTVLGILCMGGIAATVSADEMNKMKPDMKHEMKVPKDGMNGDVNDTKDAMKTGHEMKGDMKPPQDEMSGAMKEKKNEMKGDIKGTMGK